MYFLNISIHCWSKQVSVDMWFEDGHLVEGHSKVMKQLNRQQREWRGKRLRRVWMILEEEEPRGLTEGFENQQRSRLWPELIGWSSGGDASVAGVN